MHLGRLALAVGLVSLGSLPSATRAFPSYGTSVDTTCTANGWLPALPFNPNQVANPTPSTANCGLCHANASSPNANLTTAGQTFKASGYTDVRPFCQPPATNAAPTFTPVAAQRTTVGQPFQLTVRATDPERTSLTLAASNVPTGATFTDLRDGSGTFAWVPTRAQTGNFVVRFHATDAGTPAASTTMDVTIAVDALPNRPPVFDPIAAQQVTAGQLLSFDVRATDPDGDALSLSASNTPMNASFTDRGDGTGRFQWTPSATQTGNATVTFHADDAGVPMASTTLDVAIGVGAVSNHPPVLDPIGNRSVNVGSSLAVAFSATDPDRDPLSFSAMPLPPGAVASATGFTWKPTSAQVGNYTVTATVTDSGTPAMSDAETFVVTVGSVNRAPTLSPIGDRSAIVGEVVRIAVTASDLDGNAITLGCLGLPADAPFTDLGGGTGEIVWAPSTTGRWSATCTAVDDGAPPATSEQSFSLTARDPAPPPTGAGPALTDARWDASRLRLSVAGKAPALPAGQTSDLELFARLADGADVSLGVRQVELGAGGMFRADVAPFIPPCQVLAVVGGQASAPLAVAGAPARCDEQLLMQVSRARVSCDGRSLRASGRRAPPLGTVVGSDGTAGTTLFSVSARATGTFEARARASTPPRSLRVEAIAAGHRWALDALVPVTRDRCDAEAETTARARRDDD